MWCYLQTLYSLSCMIAFWPQTKASKQQLCNCKLNTNCYIVWSKWSRMLAVACHLACITHQQCLKHITQACHKKHSTQACCKNIGSGQNFEHVQSKKITCLPALTLGAFLSMTHPPRICANAYALLPAATFCWCPPSIHIWLRCVVIRCACVPFMIPFLSNVRKQGLQGVALASFLASTIGATWFVLSTGGWPSFVPMYTTHWAIMTHPVDFLVATKREFVRK